MPTNILYAFLFSPIRDIQYIRKTKHKHSRNSPKRASHIKATRGDDRETDVDRSIYRQKQYYL
jgi:hypothetical protein